MARENKVNYWRWLQFCYITVERGGATKIYELLRRIVDALLRIFLVDSEEFQNLIEVNNGDMNIPGWSGFDEKS